MTPQKTIYANLRRAPKTGAFAVVWENIACFHHASVNFWRGAISVKKERQKQFTKISGLPILTRQPSTHECTPHEPKNPIFPVFWDVRPKLSGCHQNLWNCTSFSTKYTPESFRINSFKQIRECPKQYFEHVHLTPSLPPILWNPNFYSAKTVGWTTN